MVITISMRATTANSADERRTNMRVTIVYPTGTVRKFSSLSQPEVNRMISFISKIRDPKVSITIVVRS